MFKSRLSQITIVCAALFVLVIGIGSFVGNQQHEEGIVIELAASDERPIQDRLLEAYDNNDEAAFKQLAEETGWSVAELKEIVPQIKAANEEMERLRAREESLGSWEDAIANGNMLKEDPPDEDGDIARYYDVNGDDSADFQVYFRGDEPYVWRYLDEKGEPYG